MVKTINIALFGIGTVGGTLIDQLLESVPAIINRKYTHLNVFAVANSKKVLLNANGIPSDWEEKLQNSEYASTVQNVIDYAKRKGLKNLVAVDNTASEELARQYNILVDNEFDLVSSNKIANTLEYDFYKNLQHNLRDNQKKYLYSTNAGAGLPLIDTVKSLYSSDAAVTRVCGVFSGSLSYIFNTFSKESRPFSSVLKEAMTNKLTEPDPREDLNGNDVGRKILILARELGLVNELEDISIHNLVPAKLRNKNLTDFLTNINELDELFQKIKEEQKQGHVLRYIGELCTDASKDKADLKVSLVSVPAESSLGQVKGVDSIFEIYTDLHGDNPIIIQGAGAGAAVTARGVISDVLKIADHKR